MWCELAVMVLYLKDFIPTLRHPDTTPYESWHNMKPDVLHLHPIGCTAYAKIPVERDGSKLDACSVKGILIGYFSCDAYWIFDPDSQKIFRSRDVVFEEGTGHKSLPSFVDPPGSDGTVKLPSTPPIADTGAGVTVQSDVSSTSPSVVPLTPVKPVLCCSTQAPKPSTAIVNSIASKQAIADACMMGEDWATNSTAPTEVCYVSLPGILHDASDNTPALYATTVEPLLDPLNHWLPSLYTEAMTHPDIWRGPIEKELEVMHECEVWKVIDPPPGVCLVQTCWTFANKYDGDGTLTTRKPGLLPRVLLKSPEWTSLSLTLPSYITNRSR